MNHFFVQPSGIEYSEDTKTGTVRIEGNDFNHVKNVLRMKQGDELLISDGEGNDYHCVIADFLQEADAEEAVALLRILDREVSGTEPSVRFCLFQGLPKADKFEYIIQKAVELGVYEIIPVEMARSVVKYDAKKKTQKQDRWQKIAESAAKQSHRGIIPEVRGVMGYKEALKYAKENMDIIFLPYENFKGIQFTKKEFRKIKPGMKIGIIIGPEGGFEQEEVDAAEGAVVVSLGKRILRTETAPLMILSVLMFQMEE